MLQVKDPRPEAHDACMQVRALIEDGYPACHQKCEQVRQSFPDLFIPRNRVFVFSPPKDPTLVPKITQHLLKMPEGDTIAQIAKKVGTNYKMAKRAITYLKHTGEVVQSSNSPGYRNKIYKMV